MIDQAVQAVCSQLGIDDLLDRYPSTLSGGEQQRVALARALVIKPSVLLLDEPLAAVDIRLRRKLRGELKQLHRQMDTTFLHVTHDVTEAVQLGQRIGVMLDGRIHQIGTPEDLFHHPSDAAVAEFLGMRNVFAVSGYENGSCSVDGQLVFVGSQPEAFKFLWIRPEEILLSLAPFESSARNQLSCVVDSFEVRDVFVVVWLSCNGLRLSSLITYNSFTELGLKEGQEVYATFKSTAIQCF
jgi:molybdate/tungstate transport system ATP-binding protein